MKCLASSSKVSYLFKLSLLPCRGDTLGTFVVFPPYNALSSETTALGRKKRHPIVEVTSLLGKYVRTDSTNKIISPSIDSFSSYKRERKRPPNESSITILFASEKELTRVNIEASSIMQHMIVLNLLSVLFFSVSSSIIHNVC